MTQHQQTSPPSFVRRVVTAHDTSGKEVIRSDCTMPLEPIPEFNVAMGKIWVTDSFPSNDNNTNIDGAKRDIEGVISAQQNAVCLFTDLEPGQETLMHRTSTIDLNVLVSGEVILVLPGGIETHLRNPGDTVVQRGTEHMWKNPGVSRTRWVTFVIDAAPATVDGQQLPDVIRRVSEKSEARSPMPI